VGRSLLAIRIMRRRDYELIAQALKNARPKGNAEFGPCPRMYQGWLRSVESVGSVMELDNAAFDYQLWLHNCGVEPT